jgi:arylsulfatase A-like enzyme
MSDHDKVPLNEFDPTGQYPESDRYLGQGFSTELFADAAIRFVSEAHGEPFFLYLAFTSPHDPRTPPAAFAYDPADVPLPPNLLPEHPFDNGELRVRDELLAGFPRTPDEVRRHVADYYGMISHQDAWMGRVLAALPENTIVVYTADHGLAVGQHGLMGKQNLYDHSIRVPLLVAGPDVPSGGVVDMPTTHADLFPTLAELCGLTAPAWVGGRSLASWDPPPVPTGAVYKDVQRCVTDGRHKLIRYRRSERGAGTERVQLFDVVEDPYEMNDLSEKPEHRATIERLAVQLAVWQHSVGDPWI